MEHASELGYVLDFALVHSAAVQDGGDLNAALPRVCLELDGPVHFHRASSTVMLAYQRVKLRQLDAVGWQVLVVPHFTAAAMTCRKRENT